MVSGFLTSPFDHMRIVSAVARPIRIWLKSFTSSIELLPWTPRGAPSSRGQCEVAHFSSSSSFVGGSALSEAGAALATPLVFLVGAPLGAAEVDAELLGGAEHVLVELAHLDLLAGVGQHLDVEAEGLHLLDEH